MTTLILYITLLLSGSSSTPPADPAVPPSGSTVQEVQQGVGTGV